MGDMMNEGQHLGNDIDLSQFYQIFFEEAGENLDQMEQMLLALDVAAAQDEELNAIFRCAHSIKGGAATFSLNGGPLTDAWLNGKQIKLGKELRLTLQPGVNTLVLQVSESELPAAIQINSTDVSFLSN